jgi:hypothetical protein
MNFLKEWFIKRKIKEYLMEVKNMDFLPGKKLIITAILGIAVVVARVIFGDITIAGTVMPGLEIGEAANFIWTALLVIFGKQAWNRSARK